MTKVAITSDRAPGPKTHAIRSASTAKRWMNCPGSIKASEGLERESSEYAKEGTAAHALAEYCLMKGIWSAGACVGYRVSSNLEQVWRPDEPIDVGAVVDFIVDVDMADAVQVYLDTVAEYIEEMSLEGHIQVIIEQRLDMSWLRPDMGGTADCVIAQFLGKLVVIDYKHGRGVVVETEENEQMMYYAVGTAEKLGWDFSEAELVIVQPRAAHADGPVRRWTTTVERLQRFRDELAEAADRTDAPDAPRKAGDWCKFCPAAATCQTLSQVAYDAACLEFVDDEPVTFWDTQPDEDMSEEDLARAMKAIPLLDAFCKAVKTEVQRRLFASRSVPGFKLVHGKANRQWVDPTIATSAKHLLQQIERVAEELEVDLPELKVADLQEEPKVKSPAKVEKLGKALRPIVASLAHKPQGKVSVAPESDPRDAVDPTKLAQDDFPDEESEG